MLSRIVNKIISTILSIGFVSRLAKYLWSLYVTVNLSKIKTKNLNELFTDIKTKQLDMQSDTSEDDCKAIEKVCQMVLKDNVRIAEVGSWKGMSTAVIAKTISNFNGRVFAIDHWKGNNGVPHHKQSQVVDVFTVFRDNMQILGLNNIYPLVMDSLTAATVFGDKSLDLVFIDADHTYQAVKHDIEAWLPKVKSGGIICGHDCQEYYTKLGEFTKEVDAHLEDIAIPGVCHPGVTKALYDIFQDRYEKVSNSCVWWLRL